MTDTKKVLEKLGKLKAHMDSAQDIGSEAEAQAFAAAIQKLLMQHKLEMTDIQYSAHVKEEPVEEHLVGGDLEYAGTGKKFRCVLKDYPDVEVLSRRVDWMETLGAIVAQAHNCSMLISQKSSQIWFVGMRSNIAVAEYIYITMLRTIDKLSHKEYMKFRRECRGRDDGGGRFLHETWGFKASWIRGFITRLAQRFREAKLKMEQDNSGTALVRINKEAIAVKDYLKAKFGHEFVGEKRGLCQVAGCNKPEKDPVHFTPAKILNSRDSHNSEGYRSGKSKADEMRLDANAFESGSPDTTKELKS
jgi:hypothetical protein